MSRDRSRRGNGLAQDFVPEFADFDGDGGLEMVLWHKQNPSARGACQFRVLTLATGETRAGVIRSTRRRSGPRLSWPAILDGDGSGEVVVCEQPLVLAEPRDRANRSRRRQRQGALGLAQYRRSRSI